LEFTLRQILVYIAIFGFIGVIDTRHRPRLIAIASSALYIYATRNWSILFVLFLWICALVPGFVSAWLSCGATKRKIYLLSVCIILTSYLIAVLPGQSLRTEGFGVFGLSFIVLQALSLCRYSHTQDCSSLHTSARVASLGYLIFPPQMAGGPIETVENLLPQVSFKFSRISLETWLISFSLIGHGLIKKVILLPYLLAFIRLAFALPAPHNLLCLVLALPFSYLYVYQDIQSYTSIAQGLGLICGISLSRNFNAPFKASNFSDFWRRWHITVSDWFFHNISKPMLRYLAANSHKSFLWTAPVLTFIVFGIWHGFSLASVFGGVIFAAAFLIERSLRKHRLLGLKSNYLLVHTSVSCVSLLFILGNGLDVGGNSGDLTAIFGKAIVSACFLFLLGLDSPPSILGLRFSFLPVLAQVVCLVLGGILISILLPSHPISSEYIKMQ
jgi:D-alanyl-lipoteichoic acid acyltransferase DltB (MBOAT superfamily)